MEDGESDVEGNDDGVDSDSSKQHAGKESATLKRTLF